MTKKIDEFLIRVFYEFINHNCVTECILLRFINGFKKNAIEFVHRKRFKAIDIFGVLSTTYFVSKELYQNIDRK